MAVRFPLSSRNRSIVLAYSRRNLILMFATAGAGLAAGDSSAAVEPEIPALDFAIAGGTYYSLAAALPTLAIGERLDLRREPDNPYDRFAIAVQRQSGAKLGYVPRAANQTLARLIDAGWRADAVVAGFIDAAMPSGDIAFTATASGDPRVLVTLRPRAAG
jgi:HIRAN domain